MNSLSESRTVTDRTFVIATIKPWNLEAADAARNGFPGKVEILSQRDELTRERLDELKPRYVFFPHWSWIVPDDVLAQYECVCFHMTDLPYGRGGSPLQNLIARGHTRTRLSAIRMVQELDAGPVYMKCDLDLSGRAEDIFRRAAEVIMDMARDIALNEPTPSPQVGEATHFQRRKPQQSRLPESADMTQIYDHIRMLDAPTYPLAYIDHGDFRLTFTNAAMQGDSVAATVSIAMKPKDAEGSR